MHLNHLNYVLLKKMLAVKAALNMSGFSVGVPRSPLIELPATMQDGLRQVLNSYELDPFLQAADVRA